MSVQAEFLLIALALFLWESLLWLPMRNCVLKRRWRSRHWQARMPGHLFATRAAGVLPLLPGPLEGGLAPCQSPALFPGAENVLHLESREGVFFNLGTLDWKNLVRDGHHLRVNGTHIRLTSPRTLAALSHLRQRGYSVSQAFSRQWQLALSPSRAAREWRRWRLASSTLRFFCPVLTVGFFVGLPLLYLYTSLLNMLLFSAWLWLLMVFISAQLWWLGRRVYPEARGALRMDALLSLLVPFHAMRASENASLHAFATTHPAALLLSTGDLENPWLAHYSRRILFPASPADAAWSSFIRPLLEKHLDFARYDTPPGRDEAEESARYCPRCHALYLKTTTSCQDCHGVALREF